MIFPREQWKEIKGYEGLYEVSSVGRVRNKKTKKFLKPDKNKQGYLRICLCKDGTPKKYLVHRLVAKAFIPNPENKPQIDHINTIRTDNYYKNLRWATPIENSNNELSKRHSSEAHKGIASFYGKHHSEETRRKISEAQKGKRCSEENPLSKRVEIFKNGISLGVFPCAREIERKSEKLFRKKLLSSAISQVCTGKRKSHKGFQFKFVD